MYNMSFTRYVSGLVHISKIAWEHINHPSQVLSMGEEVEVLIEGIDIEKEQIGLNRKELQPSPWQKFADEHLKDIFERLENLEKNKVGRCAIPVS